MEIKQEINICSYNVRGLGGITKRRKIFNFLRHTDYDVMLLQETHSCTETELLWLKQWKGQIFFSHGTNRARGVCIMFKNKLDYDAQVVYQDAEGRLLVLNSEIKGVPLTIMNIYAPNTDDPTFFKDSFSRLENLDTMELVVGGDFNLTLNNDMDRRGSCHNHTKSSALLNEYLLTHNLCDIWRNQNENKFAFTWSRMNPMPHYARLDYLLVSDALASRIRRSNIVNGLDSDHQIVDISIISEKLRRRKGFWRLNTLHLQDAEYLKNMRMVIQRAKKKYRLSNPATKLEMVKCEATNYSIYYSITKARNLNGRIKRLQDNANFLENLLAKKHEQTVYTALTKVKEEMDQIMQQKTKTLMFLSNCKWYNEGEKPSKYFFNLAKANYNKKTMYELVLEDGTTTSDSHRILAEQYAYYDKLYTARPDVHFSLKNDTGSKISTEDSEAMEQLITLEEVREAILHFPPEKAPGVDGLQAIFYQTFIEEFAELLHAAYLYAYEKGVLHITARRGYLTLIPKKDRNLLLLKNWRPLTMLSMEYKVLSKILDNRLKTVLDGIIEQYQTGFMSG